jgi:hypothetical protein
MNLETILHPSPVTGIEIILKGNDLRVFNVVILRKTGSRLAVEKKEAGIESMELLTACIDRKSPLILSITGKGIIHKKISISAEEHTTEVLLNKVLPGAAVKDFSVQAAQSGEELFVSVIRNSILENVLGELARNGISAVSECFLGPFALNNAIEQLSLSGEFTVSDQCISIENNHITDVRLSAGSQAHEAVTGIKDLPFPLFIAFSSACSYFISLQKGIENSQALNILKDEFNAKRKFERTGFAALAILFLLLLVNYFVFSSYWKKNNELSVVYSLNETAVQQYDTLKKELAFKKKFLEDNGLLQHSRTSLYADELAKELPSSIRWSSLKINPLKTLKNSEENAFTFENRVIDITGKCEQSAELNLWMKRLKHYSWAKDVLLINYTQSQKNEPGVFQLRVILN